MPSTSRVKIDIHSIKNEPLRSINISGSDTGSWFIDLKNGSGSVGSGDPSSGPADVTFTLKDSDFLAMFQGKLKPTNAFMTGKLKLKVRIEVQAGKVLWSSLNTFIFILG